MPASTTASRDRQYTAICGVFFTHPHFRRTF